MTEAEFEALLRRARGWRIRPVRGDHNCLFRAIADQVYGTEEAHRAVRAAVMDYIDLQRDFFSAFVSEPFEEYVARKRQDRCHGNHVEIQAAAELYARPVEVYVYSLTPLTIYHHPQPEEHGGPVAVTEAGGEGRHDGDAGASSSSSQPRPAEAGSAGDTRAGALPSPTHPLLPPSRAVAAARGAAAASPPPGVVRPPLRLTYHGGQHYNSLVDPSASTGKLPPPPPASLLVPPGRRSGGGGGGSGGSGGGDDDVSATADMVTAAVLHASDAVETEEALTEAAIALSIAEFAEHSGGGSSRTRPPGVEAAAVLKARHGRLAKGKGSHHAL